jgi:hypothetical protein
MTTEKCDIKESEIFKLSERYLVFIDETGDPFMHRDVKKYDHPTVFPVMTVTALIVSSKVYQDVLVPSVDEIKQLFWNARDIHLHSNEIRRKDGIFKILLNPDNYRVFKEKMLNTLEKSSAILISSSINKMKLLKTAEKFKADSGQEYNPGDLYMKNIDWVFERIGHFLKTDNAKVIFEARGKKESRRIQSVLTEARKNGTFYHSKERFKNISGEVLFFTKKDNVNGIQMADYCTYPFARHAKDPKDTDNKLFDLLHTYVYKGDFGEYGLKEWP